MTKDELSEIIRLHALWLASDPEGERADLRGADLRVADMSEAKLECADMRWADMRGADMRGADMRRADMREADMRRADMSEADLTGTDLSYAEMARARLRDARGLPAAPVIELIHTRVYEAASQPGALDMSDWHTCATTHCRAGWVVTLAGEAGRELEAELGTSAAAALIYMASDPEMECVPDWHASEEDALADMRRLAEMEASR